MPRKSRKVLMVMKVAKLGWAGPEEGQEQGKGRVGAGQGQSQSRAVAREEDRQNRAVSELSREGQSRVERGQALGRSWEDAG